MRVFFGAMRLFFARKAFWAREPPSTFRHLTGSIVSDEENIVVLDNIILVLLPHEIVGLDLSLASQADKVLAAHDFRPDKNEYFLE